MHVVRMRLVKNSFLTKYSDAK